MIVSHTGLASPGLHMLGSAEIPAYLLEAPQPALFDAGFACLGPVYAEEARQILQPSIPSWLFITHMHFDHCGAVSYLKQSFPGLKVAASARAAQIIARPGAQDLITRLNQHAFENLETWRPGLGQPVDFAPFEVDVVLSEGQEISLGGDVGVRVLATPGHTWDFLTFYVPSHRLLICSEAGGCAYADGYIYSEFLVDYQSYVDNLERLLALEAEVMCQGHRMVYVGRQEVRQRLEGAQRAVLEFRAWVDELLDREHGEVEEVLRVVKAREWDHRSYPKQPEPAYLLNVRARIKHLEGLRQAAMNGAGKEE